MVILVEFDGHKWSVSPDPAIVQIGTPIQWRFRTQGAPVSAIDWTVYFDQGSPFGKQSRVIVTSVGQIVSGVHFNHTDTTSAVVANQAGDFKYGVRAEDARTGQQLGDDDPRLIVLA